MRFAELRTAKAWGLVPSQWDALDEIDRLEMMAETVAEDRMAAYEVAMAKEAAAKAQREITTNG